MPPSFEANETSTVPFACSAARAAAVSGSVTVVVFPFWSVTTTSATLAVPVQANTCARPSLFALSPSVRPAAVSFGLRVELGLVVLGHGGPAAERDVVDRRLQDRLRRVDAERRRLLDHRGGRRRRAARRRRVAGQGRVAPAVRVALDAAVGRPAEPRLARQVLRVGVVDEDVQPQVGRVDRRREVGERDLHLERVAGVRARSRSRRPASRAPSRGPPWWLSASRSKHGGLPWAGSFVIGKMPVLNVVAVFSDWPRGSSAISTESVRQWRLQSVGRDLRAEHVVVDVHEEVERRRRATRPSRCPSSRPPSRTASLPTARLRSSAGPGYSPAPSTPFTTGAAGACGIVVTGTSSSAERLAARAGAARGRDRSSRSRRSCRPGSRSAAPGSCSSRRSVTDVSPPAASAGVRPAARGSPRSRPAGSAQTLPDCAWPLQLCRSTRTERVSPMPIESTGLTSPPSCGTPASRAHCSNCATCGSRCTVPCDGRDRRGRRGRSGRVGPFGACRVARRCADAPAGGRRRTA